MLVESTEAERLTRPSFFHKKVGYVRLRVYIEATPIITAILKRLAATTPGYRA